MPKRSTCNEWSQLEADTTGKPPSVRVAVVLIEPFVLNIRNTNDQPPPQELLVFRTEEASAKRE